MLIAEKGTKERIGCWGVGAGRGSVGGGGGETLLINTCFPLKLKIRVMEYVTTLQIQNNI